MTKSYRVDAKSKILKADGGDQIPHGDSVISADHLEKCSKTSKGEASIITKLGISDKRAAKEKAKS